METANQKRNRLLGEPFGTASSRLRKMILFSIVVRISENICYRCRGTIENIDEFSIEHTIPWQSSKTPRETFFDLDSIAFSHLGCNSSAALRPNKYATTEERREANRMNNVRYYSKPDKRELKLRNKRVTRTKV